MIQRILSGVLAVVLMLVPLLPVVAEVPSADELSADEVLALIEALELSDRDLALEEGFRITVSPDDLSVHEGLDEEWQHILLLGTDTGSKMLNYGRTDAMLIASIHAQSKQLKLTSLVRDMLVDIPGLSTQNRINTANSFGGPLLAIKTVNEVLGLNITRYVSINFNGFSTLIDALGGVEIELSAGEAGEVGLSKGRRTLNGKQALEYARIRKLDNNFGRNGRQRNLLEAIMSKAKGLGINDMLILIPQVMELVSTNLSVTEVMALLGPLMAAADKVQMLGLPLEGDYRYHQTERGASVVVFDQSALREAFSNFIGE